MKLLPIILLLSLGAKGQTKPGGPPQIVISSFPTQSQLDSFNNKYKHLRLNVSLINADPTKRDTVKCWVVGTETGFTSNLSGDLSGALHLVLLRAWVIRDYQILAYEIDEISDSTFKSTPIFSTYPTVIKYLAPNRRDSLAVIGDFKPIIQEWK